MSATDIRTELFTTFQELSKQIPEMRAGQLISAVGELCADIHIQGLWEATDAKLLEAVWQFQRIYESATDRNSTT